MDEISGEGELTMKILILGGEGMLGHELLLSLSQRHSVKATVRQSPLAYAQFGLFNETNTYFDVDVLDQNNLMQAMVDFQPEAVINAVGIVKQRHLAKESIPSLEINALLPQRLSLICRAIGARLIQLSTDCVFSGKKGFYTEEDKPDPEDIYGQTKLLGEVNNQHAVTIRSSIIGLELTRKTSLIEWYLAQKGEIKGFRKAIYSGITTMEMSRLIELILTRHPDLHGIWHVASKPINKFDLLNVLNARLQRDDIKIIPSDELVCDRSLCGDKFTKLTGYKPPTWDQMLTELAERIDMSMGVFV